MTAVCLHNCSNLASHNLLIGKLTCNYQCLCDAYFVVASSVIVLCLSVASLYNVFYSLHCSLSVISTRVWHSLVLGVVSTSSTVSLSRCCRSSPSKSSPFRTPSRQRRRYLTSSARKSNCSIRSASLSR